MNRFSLETASERLENCDANTDASELASETLVELDIEPLDPEELPELDADELNLPMSTGS